MHIERPDPIVFTQLKQKLIGANPEVSPENIDIKQNVL
jgi:hypothetical protein